MRDFGRVVAHGAIILSVVLLAVAAGTVITGSSDGWLTAFLNGPVDLFAGRPAGIHFHTQQLHAAWQRGCPVLVELNSTDVTFQNAAAGHLAAETVRLCGSEVSLHNVAAGSPQHERLLTTQDVRANLLTHSAFMERLVVADRTGKKLIEIDKGELANASLTASGMVALPDADSRDPVVRAGQVQTSSVHRAAQANGELNLALLSVTDLQLLVKLGRSTALDLAKLRESGQELATFAHQAVLSGRKLVSVIHDFSFIALLAATVFVTVLKWYASREVHPLRGRVLVSFVPASVAYGLFVLFRSVSTAAGLALAAAALGVAAAIVLWQILYRRSRDWLSRWEPFALDAFAPAPLVLLLLLWAFELRLPAGNIPGSIVMSSVSVSKLNARLESNAFTSEVAVPAANLTALQLIFQPGTLGLNTATLSRFELNGGDARAQDETGQELARGRIQRLIAAGIHVGNETPKGGRPLDVKELQIHAGIESGVLARQVRQFQWLPPEWRQPLRLQLAASGSVSRREHLQFNASAEVRSRVLNFGATAAGDSDSVEITRLHTLKDSPLRIGDASGTITWARGLETALTMREIRGTGFGAESGSVNAYLHSPEFTLKSRWQGANFSLNGYQSSLDSVALDTALTERTFSTSTLISGATVSGPKDGAQHSWLEADFPNVEAYASGTRSGWKSLSGTAGFRVADGEQSILSPDRALNFSADPSRGTVIVPEQTLELRQGMTGMIPPRLGLTLSVVGDLQSINLHTRIPAMILPDVAPLRIETEGLQLSCRFRRGNASEVRLSSGWNRLVLPAMGGDWTLKEIAKLNLETDGTATGSFFKQLDALRERASGFHFERERSFRIEGKVEPGASSLIIQGREGTGVRISPMVDTRLLRIKRGRIAESDIHARASGIRTLDGHGNLSTSADWKAGGNSSSLTVHVPWGDGADLLEMTFLRQPGSLRFSLDQQLALARFMPEIQPFLEQAGIHLSEFEIGATLLQLEGQADFAGSEWATVAARAEAGPGPLFRFTGNTSSAKRLEVTSVHGVRVSLTGGDGAMRVTAEAPGLAVRSNGGAEHANIDASVVATLSHSASASPFLSRIRTTVAGIGAGMEGARRAFQSSEDKPPLTWKLTLSNGAAEEPALSVDLDRLKSRLRAEPSFVSLGSARLDFSLNAAADLSLQEDQLILDALLQASYQLRGKGLGLHPADIKLPLLIAFGDALQPVNAAQGPLWDSQRYSSIWDRYQPVNATAGQKHLWHWNEVALGPVEIEELSIAPPFHAAIELSKDAVQMDVPVKGSFLFGESAGSLQSQVRWAGDAAVLDSFFGCSLQDAQAAALRVATVFGYQPLVQDHMGLSLAASTRGLTLSRRILEAALADPGSFNQFDKLALDLSAGSVPGSTGRLQLESGFDVKHMNNLLREITSDVRLTFPPEAIRWQSAKVKLLLRDGTLDNNQPMVALTAVEGLRNSLTQFSGSLRLFAGRESSIPVQDIIHTLMLFDERLP